MVFLDASPVIYLIEQPATFGPRATTRVTALLASGEHLAVSDLVRMECQVGPLKANDQVMLAQYLTFFQYRTGSSSMSRVVLLDTGPLGMVSHPRPNRCSRPPTFGRLHGLLGERQPRTKPWMEMSSSPVKPPHWTPARTKS